MDYLKEKGHPISDIIVLGPAKRPIQGKSESFYAVANGKEDGIYATYL